MSRKQIKELYNSLKDELQLNNNGIVGAGNILKKLLPNVEVRIDSFSHMIDKTNFILIAYIKDLLSESTLEEKYIKEIQEEYSDYDFILPTNDINILLTENEICIYQIVEIYFPEGEIDIYKLKLSI